MCAQLDICVVSHKRRFLMWDNEAQLDLQDLGDVAAGSELCGGMQASIVCSHEP